MTKAPCTRETSRSPKGLLHPPGRIETVTKPEPFLRWAGGKRQLLPILHAALPRDLDPAKVRFFEPFVGGGAVMFSLSEILTMPPTGRGRVVINDINAELVSTYMALRDNNAEVIAKLKRLRNNLSEADYYKMRASTPTSNVDRAVRLIYLNRTGFNGLYRVNASGDFNVPWGKLKNPTVCNEHLLSAVGDWLKHVEIRHGSFSSAVEDAKAGDVVYFDPPYIPLSLTSAFSKYSKDDFRELDQYALAGVIRGLIERGVRVVLSNSFTPTTLKIFGPVINLRVLDVTRTIAAKRESRGTVQEVIGISYRESDCADPALVQGLSRVRRY